jgi:D-amino-acid dehydrogenase
VDAHYQLSSLLHVAPFLWRYFRGSAPAKARETLAANIPLFEQCLLTHGELAAAAGADHLIARNGWIAGYRTDAGLRSAETRRAELAGLGIDAAMLSPGEIAALEPHLAASRFAGAVHFRDPWTVSDPGALTKAYAGLFEKEGGTFVIGDAAQIRRTAGKWQLPGVIANEIVVAMGPWSKTFLDRLGVALPMGVKRGYHRHYAAKGNAVLTRPVVDDHYGFVLAPMSRGIRLTTGAEFARLQAPTTPVQIDRAEPVARALFPLGETVDRQAWLGARPVFPDLRPAIGKAPGLNGVWLNFGHAHHGLTLGPATGLLLSQIMTGAEPFTDPAPYSASRFF